MDNYLKIKQKKLYVLIILCSWIFISWGNVGHRIMNSNATLSFPAEIDFLISWADGLADHASDADRRKSSDHTEENKHYIDIDNFPEFIATGQITQNFDSLVLCMVSILSCGRGFCPGQFLRQLIH